MKRCKKKIETSKLLLRVLLSLVTLTTLFDFIFSFTINSDSDILVTLTQSVYALSTIGVSFYFWKAKCENLHKYKQDDKIGDN